MAEIGLRFASVGLFQIRAHGRARLEQLTREFANEWMTGDERPAEIDKVAGKKERALLYVIRFSHVGRVVHPRCR